MSELPYSESSGALIDQLLYLDREMTAKMYVAGKKINDIYQIYNDRLSLLERFSLIPLTEQDKLLLEHKKEDIYLEFKLFKLKKDVEKQLSDFLIYLEDTRKDRI